MKTIKAMVYPSLKEHIDFGGIWHNLERIPSRSIIEIKCNKKSIRCEAFFIDNNYKKEYNKEPRKMISGSQNVIVLSKWYRQKLNDIQLFKEYEFSYKCTGSVISKLFACLQHPQLVQRTAAWLGITSVLLGVLSIVLSIY